MTVEPQGTKDQMAQQEKYIGWHVVAFLDLLGQQDTLRKITALPSIEKQEEVDAFKRKIGELYKPLYALQTFFKASVKPFIEGSINENRLMAHEQELLKQLRSTPIFYQHFSDSLIVHIPLRNNIGKFPCRAIYAVLAATASTFLSCMSNGWAIRGGIELGLAMDIDNDEIYGPALARAYTLENKVAGYPRVIIGDELTRYLQIVAGNQAVTAEERGNSLLAEKSLNLIRVDDDGYAFIDWLGEDMRVSFRHTGILQNAYNVIIQESIRHKENKDSKLGFRYTLLRNYVESRLPDWGLSVQSEE